MSPHFRPLFHRAQNVAHRGTTPLDHVSPGSQVPTPRVCCVPNGPGIHSPHWSPRVEGGGFRNIRVSACRLPPFFNVKDFYPCCRPPDHPHATSSSSAAVSSLGRDLRLMLPSVRSANFELNDQGDPCIASCSLDVKRILSHRSFPLPRPLSKSSVFQPSVYNVPISQCFSSQVFPSDPPTVTRTLM